MAIFNWFKKNKDNKKSEELLTPETKDIEQNIQNEINENNEEKNEQPSNESFEQSKHNNLNENIDNNFKQNINNNEMLEENITEKLEENDVLKSENITEVKNVDINETIEKNSSENLEITNEAETKQNELTAEKIRENFEKIEEIEEEISEISSELIETLFANEHTNSNNDNVENEEKKQGFFSKIKSGLAKTKNSILGGIENVLNSFSAIDEDLFEELEESLIMSDIGTKTSCFIIDKVREIVKSEKIKDVEKVKEVIINVITEILLENTNEFNLSNPSVLLIIGVNGVGKTTTIGKLTNNYQKQGKKVMLAAADTFRAAAIDQLQVWGERNNVDVIKHQENSDPAAVVFDAIQASKARNIDLLICDTAGRLHNKKNLMEELKKISKVINREHSEAQVETLLVLDATTGQNALQQAKLFSEVANITGIVLTKLDGTAKGGIIIAIKNELKIPIRFIGVGEGIDDLRPFNAEEFSTALFE